MIEDERIVRLQKAIVWFNNENERLQKVILLKFNQKFQVTEQNNALIDEVCEKNDKAREANTMLEGKVKAAIRYLLRFNQIICILLNIFRIYLKPILDSFLTCIDKTSFSKQPWKNNNEQVESLKEIVDEIHTPCKHIDFLD